MTELAGVDLSLNVLIVAEIGNNHEGNFEVARELVAKAGEAGVHAVKFQTFRTKHFVRPAEHARLERLKKCELSFRQFEELRTLTASHGLKFFSTPLDLESAKFLSGIVDAYKIASGDNDFYPLIDNICTTGKPIIVSTGVSDLEQVRRTRDFIVDRWSMRGIKQTYAFLHCVSCYPVPLSQANLKSITVLRDTFDCPVGYSDHTDGVDACLAAVAIGARIIEKHFTLNKNLSDFRDHQLSADPAEMKTLVERVRTLQGMLGCNDKSIQACEKSNATLIRRSITAAANLPAGHRLELCDLGWTRPADGLRPGEEHLLLGRALKHPVSTGDIILTSDVV